MSAYTPDDVLPAPQRRIRHITSLQIRNLTPFPVRDALAQTLTQPVPNSLSLPQQPADDIDLTLASRRRRRVSASSVFNAEIEDEGGLGATGTWRRNRTNSRGSSQSVRNTVAASGPPTIRPRARTSSKSSVVQTTSASPFVESQTIDPRSDWDTVPLGGQFVTHSQRALEKIVSSRLVETFVTLTLPPPPVSGTSSESQPDSPPTPPPGTATGPSRKGKDVSVRRAISASVANHRRGISTSSSTSTLSTASSSHPKRPHSLNLPSANPSSRNRSGTNAPSSASSRTTNFPSPPPTPPPRSPPRQSPTPSSSGARSSTFSNRKPGKGKEEQQPSLIPTPFYISPLHLPSTNPRFSHLDPEREFAPWGNLSGSRFKVAIWGSDNHGPRRDNERDKDMKGKGKASTHPPGGSSTKDGSLWKILEEWVVDLDDMEPLSDDVVAHHLPSNTLLLTVSSGETFRISPMSSALPSRAPSPLGPEYNSDGEVNEIRHLRWEQEESDNRKRERETLEKSRRETRMKRSACWQDLVKIVNLQTCIIDTQESLEEIVRNCDLLVEGDGHNMALREVSERGEWLRSLGSERDQVMRDSARVKDSVEARRKALKLRRDALAAARTIHTEDLRAYVAQAQEVDSERQRHAILISSLSPLRTTLLQAVSFIFPIEPLSAPDLLFTILGVPLPIPLSASDPAPPLSLPSQPEVTEDNTATSLGYVAQVVQLISGYLGKGLVYPVTCCGSRSVIKDPISAMMGPRVFPLYSKGVETYRFEYGVFLLNKDIEMLMMDRNLRAMDMRHTLPNLKNLLLTLTTGEDVKQARRIGSPTSVIIPSGLQSPTRAISPLALEASHSEAYGETLSNATDTAASRKSTPFLSPLAAILRARYPSSAGRPTVKVVEETPETIVDGDGSAEDSPELRTGSSDDTPLLTRESKTSLKTNGNAVTRPSINAQGKSFEKLAKSDETSSPLVNAT